MEERRRRHLTDINKRLIQRCANTLARDREFSGPEIMSYLMGWDDRFESHYYVGISADAIMTALKEQYPGLSSSTGRFQLCGHETFQTSSDDRAHTIIMVAGAISLKDQLYEYSFRGDEMREMSYLDFMLDTYDGKTGDIDVMGANSRDATNANHGQRGRTPNRRVAYREGFTKPGRCRIFRTAGHETLPHFMGGWFPRNDRPAEKELYSASMLTLLKPWTDLAQIKTDDESFESVFEQFVDTAPKRTTDIVENIQYYYECYDGAKKPRDADQVEHERNIRVDFDEGDGDLEIVRQESMDDAPITVEVTDEDIELAYESRGATRERLHAEIALNTALDHAVFQDGTTSTVFLPTAEKAHMDDIKTFKGWEEQLKAACRRESDEGGPPLLETIDATVSGLSNDNEVPGVHVAVQIDDETTTGGNRPKRALLKDDQRRAHDIIETQLLKRLAGK